MYTRVTQLEIDIVRISTEAALEMFRAEVAPALREEPGYRGVLVLSTPDGAGILISLWETAEQAAADTETGFYPDTLARYVTVFRAPPGRERYTLSYTDLPSLTTA